MEEQGFCRADYTVHEVCRPGSPPPDSWSPDSYGAQQARDAFNISGKSVCVAVIDTGVFVHPDIPNVVPVDYTGDGPVDSDGHGTHCCGIVGKCAPGAKIISMRVFGKNNCAAHQNIVKALKSIIKGKHGKVDIVNMSLGAGEPSEVMRELLLRLAAKGIIIVCAAGNESDHSSADAPRFGTISWPAHFNSTIAVGSINKAMKRSAFSSSGPKITVMAPGERIVSTWLDGKHAVLSGTSMASPYVAGCLALLLEHANNLGLPKPDSSKLLWCFSVSSGDMEEKGFDFFTGYGYIQPAALINRYTKFCQGGC